jgi:hypothetical protein
MRANLSATSKAQAAEAERQFIMLARTGNADGLSELLCAAFAMGAAPFE